MATLVCLFAKSLFSLLMNIVKKGLCHLSNHSLCYQKVTNDASCSHGYDKNIKSTFLLFVVYWGHLNTE